MWLSRQKSRGLWGLLHRQDRQIEEELRFHLEMQIEENLDAGMDSSRAGAEALNRFGDFDLMKSVCHEIRSEGKVMVMDAILQDIRFGLRVLLGSPGFSLVAIFTLALGIGATSSIFSVVNGVLIEPLPFKEPDRVVQIGELNPKLSVEPVGASFANFKDWEARSEVFDSLAAVTYQRPILVGNGEPVSITAQSVTPGFFDVLGIGALIGRAEVPDDIEGASGKTVVLSHRFWQRKFGGDRDIVGKVLMLNTSAYTVAGVMPPGFKYLNEADVWIGLEIPQQLKQIRGAKMLGVIGRLKPGLGTEQAQSAMDTFCRQLEREYPDANGGWGVRLKSLQAMIVGRVEQPLLILFGAVALVLLIACVNVASLSLARATRRQRELAIRAALGASRGQLMRQLLIESLMLGLTSGAVGLLVAFGGVRLLISISPPNSPRMDNVHIDITTLLFTLGLGMLTSLLFGLAPAARAARVDLNDALKQGSASRTGGFGWLRGQRMRGLLVISEIAMALVLLIGASLLIRSLSKLTSVSPGFQAENLISMQIALPSYKYRKGSEMLAFFNDLQTRVDQLPGVRSSALTLDLPFGGSGSKNSFSIEGREASGDEWAGLRTVDAGYFQTMSIPIEQGRWFTGQDTRSAPRVAIVNNAMAVHCWPNDDPVGKRLLLGGAPHTVVGVVGNVKHLKLDGDEELELYVPFLQSPSPTMTLVARTESEPTNLAAALRAQVQAMDPDQPVEKIQTVTELVSRSVAQPRFGTLLLSLFATLALILAIVGVYGLVSFSVSRRTHEIGLRMALGAQRSGILKLVLGQSLALTLVGVAVGLVGAFLLTRLMASLLFGVTSADPIAFLAGSGVLIIVATIAAYLPALRATKVDPMVALRYE